MRQITLAALLLAACSGKQTPASRSMVPGDEAKLAARSLSKNEQQLVEKHGFAILEHGDTQSFHVGYTALFKQHQPVYVTADSLLYAWHSSYDRILQDLETEHLIPALRTMLDELRAKLRDGSGDAVARGDVDAYLAIASSFLEGKVVLAVAAGDVAMIDKMVKAGNEEKPADMELFGAQREIDFSMFRPRGHYTSSPELERYFRTMMWLGRVEIEIASKKDSSTPWKVHRRALRAAGLLTSLFEGMPRTKWQLIHDTVGAFVGPPDSMAMDGLATAMAKLGGNVNAPDVEVVAAFEQPSKQRIRTQLMHAGAKSLGFLTLGQRYVFDSQVFSDLTYGSLETKPPRLMPTPLDIAHVVLGNPAAKPLLAGEIKIYGAPYEKALASAAAEAANPDPALWDGSLYHGWLRALSTLSPDPKRDAGLPAPLTSDAWARRMMGTQLASWAELRHDNLLYAKQSVTGTVLCEYPDAYVDPYPEFYARMAMLADRGKAILAGVGGKRVTRMLAYFDHLKVTMERLKGIAERERANEPIAPKDLDFINLMVSIDGRHGGCGGPEMEPGGWYADLFYDRSKILHHEPVIADVHTQPDDEAGNRVGRVLHVGTRAPRMLVARLQHDGGKHAQTYRGYVSTYAETITKDFRRYTDEEWQAESGAIDSTPAWLRAITAR
jgi:hypothetical protein